MLQGHIDRESREMGRNKGTKLTRRRIFVNVLFLEPLLPPLPLPPIIRSIARTDGDVKTL